MDEEQSHNGDSGDDFRDDDDADDNVMALVSFD